MPPHIRGSPSRTEVCFFGFIPSQNSKMKEVSSFAHIACSHGRLPTKLIIIYLELKLFFIIFGFFLFVHIFRVIYFLFCYRRISTGFKNCGDAKKCIYSLSIQPPLMLILGTVKNVLRSGLRRIG